MADLFSKLDDYGYSEVYSFGMPGHKRKYDLTDFYEYYYKHDVTESKIFDNLHNPSGILQECMKDAARVFGADESFYLINGSSSGIFASIMSLVPKGGKLLASRFSSKAVYDAAIIRNANISYIFTDTDIELGINAPVTLDDIEEYVGNEKYDAVFLTSPTVCGYTADIKAIADYLHEKKIPLIVDASYGAHFGFADFLPESACSQGADVVVMNIANSLPAPRQTGLLHINGTLVDREKIVLYLRMFQSHDPSYVLMAGLDDCISYLETGNAEEKWQTFREMRKELSESLKDLKYIGVIDHFSNPWVEMGKMIIYSKSTFIDGKGLYDRLVDKHDIEPMMSMPDFVLFNLTLFDTKEGLDKLSEALHNMDEKLTRKEEGLEDTISLGSLAKLFDVTEKGDGSSATFIKTIYPQFRGNKVKVNICDAVDMPSKAVKVNMSKGLVSKSFISLYPYGQHIVAPGEEISQDALTLIGHYRRHGFKIDGINEDFIEVIDQNLSR